MVVYLGGGELAASKGHWVREFSQFSSLTRWIWIRAYGAWGPLLKHVLVTKLASLFGLPGDLTGDHTATECVQKSTFKIYPEGRNWKCQKKAQFMVQVPKEKEEF